ncbi:hypothetical protein IFT66_08120 [Rhizobium sp. CFBP 13726]|uniref:hypothetical protein n=1 Tax=Rhizobium sp. CFBP 13726 TaxID=2775296 RepID=UPI0013B03330|nr:hypothetical protein [Rhizobium sp. CFBP 13726]MBD8651041.1 hypothetical protein [Rhizobium sp. CFBP 13726]
MAWPNKLQEVLVSNVETRCAGLLRKAAGRRAWNRENPKAGQLDQPPPAETLKEYAVPVTINFEIPVATTGYPRRARNRKIITATLTREIDVAIIDTDEAPIAATLPDGKLRALNGAFFQSAGDVPQEGATLCIHQYPSNRPLINVTDYWSVYRDLWRTVGFNGDVDLKRPANTLNLPGLGIRDLDNEIAQSQLDTFADRSDRLIVVDDILYCKTKQPLLFVNRRHYHAKALTVDLVSDGDALLRDILNGHRNSFGIYSLADHELAIERCRGLSETCVHQRDFEHDCVLVHRPDLFDTDTTALNAAVYAHRFLGNFFDMQMSKADREGLADLINLGADRMCLVLKLADCLKAYCEKGSAASLNDATAHIVERPDTDPFWTAHSAELIEHRDFVRACLDRETVMLEFGSAV